MKLTIIVVLLIAAGAGGMIFLSYHGGTATGGSIAGILDGNHDGKRLSMTVQIADLKHAFKPIEFEAVDPPAKDPKSDKPAEETKEQTSARLATSPRIRISYGGDDKLALEKGNYVHLEGTWDKTGKLFTATSISTQCPSHYEESVKLERTAAK
jgi:hypothetical protein